jgi:hypothetical protein
MLSIRAFGSLPNLLSLYLIPIKIQFNPFSLLPAIIFCLPYYLRLIKRFCLFVPLAIFQISLSLLPAIIFCLQYYLCLIKRFCLFVPLAVFRIFLYLHCNYIMKFRIHHFSIATLFRFNLNRTDSKSLTTKSVVSGQTQLYLILLQRFDAHSSTSTNVRRKINFWNTLWRYD